MKVTFTDPNTAFQPITYSITIESEEEHQMLMIITGYDTTIPHALLESNIISVRQRDFLRNLLIAIHDAGR